MNLQHSLAELFVKLFAEKTDSEEEYALLEYGIEIFLNEFLKVILILFIGLITGEFRITFWSMFYLFIARRCSGGKHFDNNTVCTVFTVITAFLGPVLSVKVRLPLCIQIVTFIVEICLIFMFVPYTGSCKQYDERQIKSSKAAAVILFLISGILTIAFCKNSDINALLFVEMIVLLSTLDFFC